MTHGAPDSAPSGRRCPLGPVPAGFGATGLPRAPEPDGGGELCGRGGSLGGSGRARGGPRSARAVRSDRPVGGPARRVVERVVETGSGRRWSGLSGACTFAGSSSRNLRTRPATPANEREFDQVVRPRSPLPVPTDPPGEAPPQWHQGAHRRRGVGRCLPVTTANAAERLGTARPDGRVDTKPDRGRVGRPHQPGYVNRHRSAADAATVRDHPRPGEKRAGPVPARRSEDRSRGHRLRGRAPNAHPTRRDAATTPPTSPRRPHRLSERGRTLVCPEPTGADARAGVPRADPPALPQTSRQLHWGHASGLMGLQYGHE